MRGISMAGMWLVAAVLRQATTAVLTFMLRHPSESRYEHFFCPRRKLDIAVLEAAGRATTEIFFATTLRLTTEALYAVTFTLNLLERAVRLAAETRMADCSLLWAEYPFRRAFINRDLNFLKITHKM